MGAGPDPTGGLLGDPGQGLSCHPGFQDHLDVGYARARVKGTHRDIVAPNNPPKKRPRKHPEKTREELRHAAEDHE